jgi:hypothetical protein
MQVTPLIFRLRPMGTILERNWSVPFVPTKWGQDPLQLLGPFGAVGGRWAPFAAVEPQLPLLVR